MLKPGLYCIATPIGNLEDITLRALHTLKNCDLIACEDTRVSKKLLDHYGVAVPLCTYHDHNASTMRPKLIQHIRDGKAVGLISDAGTPLIRDPGTKLVRMCLDEKLYVTTLPGASAVTSALVLSGLMSDTFCFLGFFEKKHLKTIKTFLGTIVLFESSNRLVDTLSFIQEVVEDRSIAVVREITKVFEESIRGSCFEVITHFKAHPPRGEVVLVLGPKVSDMAIDQVDIQQEIQKLLKVFSVKDTVQMVATLYPYSKSEIYQMALKLKKNDGI